MGLNKILTMNLDVIEGVGLVVAEKKHLWKIFQSNLGKVFRLCVISLLSPAAFQMSVTFNFCHSRSTFFTSIFFVSIPMSKIFLDGFSQIFYDFTIR